MCTALIAFKVHPKYPFIFAGNRDEFYHRQTKPAEWWQPDSTILAGQDLQAGGTWTAIRRDGAFASLTNFRNGLEENKLAPSRGHIVTDFLLPDQDTFQFESEIKQSIYNYNGFNLIYGSVDELFFLSNRPDFYQLKVTPGIYGVSNGKWNEDWPKVKKLKQKAKGWVQQPTLNVEQIFTDMRDAQLYPDSLLPDTKIPQEWERGLSSLFVRMNGYGTRATTLILVDRDGNAYFEERSYDSQGGQQDKKFLFTIKKK